MITPAPYFAVCDFMNCLIENPVKVQAPAQAAGKGGDDEYARKRHELFSSKLLSFKLLENEPVCMLGVAMKKLRPLKPRVVIVIPRAEMLAALKALKEGSCSIHAHTATHTCFVPYLPSELTIKLRIPHSVVQVKFGKVLKYLFAPSPSLAQGCLAQKSLPGFGMGGGRDAASLA